MYIFRVTTAIIQMENCFISGSLFIVRKLKRVMNQNDETLILFFYIYIKLFNLIKSEVLKSSGLFVFF